MLYGNDTTLPLRRTCLQCGSRFWRGAAWEHIWCSQECAQEQRYEFECIAFRLLICIDCGRRFYWPKTLENPIDACFRCRPPAYDVRPNRYDGYSHLDNGILLADELSGRWDSEIAKDPHYTRKHVYICRCCGFWFVDSWMTLNHKCCLHCAYSRGYPCESCGQWMRDPYTCHDARWHGWDSLRGWRRPHDQRLHFCSFCFHHPICTRCNQRFDNPARRYYGDVRALIYPPSLCPKCTTETTCDLCGVVVGDQPQSHFVQDHFFCGHCYPLFLEHASPCRRCGTLMFMAGHTNIEANDNTLLYYSSLKHCWGRFHDSVNKALLSPRRVYCSDRCAHLTRKGNTKPHIASLGFQPHTFSEEVHNVLSR